MYAPPYRISALSCGMFPLPCSMFTLPYRMFTLPCRMFALIECLHCQIGCLQCHVGCLHCHVGCSNQRPLATCIVFRIVLKGQTEILNPTSVWIRRIQNSLMLFCKAGNEKFQMGSRIRIFPKDTVFSPKQS